MQTERPFIYVQTQIPENQRMKSIQILTALAVAFSLFSCNEPSLIGSELLENEQAEVIFSDTVSMEMTTLRADSVLGYSSSEGRFTTLLFGELQDPVFGKTTAGIYFNFFALLSDPEFSKGVLDSVVFTLAYDTANFYGNTADQFGLEIFPLADGQQLDRTKDYYSNTFIPLKTAGIAAKTFRPNVVDSLRVMEPVSGKPIEVKYRPHLRCRMDQNFAEALFATAPDVLQSDSAFNLLYPGFYLKPNKSSGGLLSFNIGDALSGMSVYFHQDTVFKRVDFTFGRVAYSTFEHDYSGSVVENQLGKPSLGDAPVFLQAMQGLKVRVQFPDLPNLADILVNKAELVVTIAELPEDEPVFYKPDPQLTALRQSTDTTTVEIDDFAYARARGNISSTFGGVPVTDKSNSRKVYKFVITNHFQEHLRGQLDDDFFIEIFRKGIKSTRSVMYGPQHTQFPAKLNLYYTVPSN